MDSHNDHPTEPKFNAITSWIEFLIFESRWLLMPMYFGLSIALLAYTYKYICDVWHLVVNITSLHEDFMPTVLGLVDITMIANLIVMIIIGSYVIFIRKFTYKSTDKPQWLDHINAGTLKVKMGMSLVGVSSIHLLQDFINVGTLSWGYIIKRITIHAVFCASTLALAWSDRIIHPPEPKELN